MSGRQSDRGRGRGRARGDTLPFRDGRGGGSQFSPGSFEPRGGGRGRGDRGGFGRGRGGPGIQIFSHPSGGPPSLDPKVEKAENEIEKANIKDGQVSKRMPQRPAFGTQGKPVMLWANYFEMTSNVKSLLFRYSIEIHPDANGKTPGGKRLKRTIELLLQEHFSANYDSIASDYRSNLISSSELPIGEQEYSVEYRNEGEDEPSPNAKTYRLRLQYTGALQVSELIDYLTSTNASAMFESKEEVVQALNIVVGQYPKSASNMFSVGANKHFKKNPEPQDRLTLGAGLEGIRGFFTSVRAATARILINVQVKHVASYEEGPLARSMIAHMRENSGNTFKLEKFLKKVVVRVTHIVKKNKSGQEIPRIKTIAALATPQDGQDLEHPPRVPRYAAGAKEVHFYLSTPGEQSGEQSKVGAVGKKGKKQGKVDPAPPTAGYISVYDFFRNTYNVLVQDPSLPVVNVGNRQNPSYLPADVCTVAPGQPSMAALSPTQTQQMIRLAVRQPSQNAQSIVADGARLVGAHLPTSTTIGRFGLAVTSRLVTVPGRELTGPQVKYANGKAANTRFGSWNMQSIQFSTKTETSAWTYLHLSFDNIASPWRNDAEISETLDHFQNKLKEVGVNAKSRVPGVKIRLNQATANTQINDAISQLANPRSGKQSIQILLVVLPKVDADLYKCVKNACDVKSGLRNVCVVAPKFAKRMNDQYFANVALKFNLKLGGQNQLLDNHKLGVVGEGKTMVVGLDVTHPSPGSSSAAPSVAAIVASIDRSLAQWPADLRIQAARQETISALDGMFKSRLRLWAQNNKQKYPENVLVYRDGVSEGQYPMVLDQELPLLRKACSDLYPAKETQQGLPRVSIIIVGKRHNTRFYATKEENADRSSNPHNGTVVDRGVTEARNWDFYLQAHTAIQGTARPAHYYTVLDEIFRGRKPSPQARFTSAADALEDLTHNMCYLYGRATKAVSICPPAYYADLVCERARCYLSRLYDPTPTASLVSGSGGGEDPDPNEVRVHEKVKNTMFYI